MNHESFNFSFISQYDKWKESWVHCVPAVHYGADLLFKSTFKSEMQTF